MDDVLIVHSRYVCSMPMLIFIASRMLGFECWMSDIAHGARRFNKVLITKPKC